VFNTVSEPIPGGPRGSFREVIAPTAFAKTLADRASSTKPSDALKLYWNHNLDIVLASTNATGEVGRLEVRTDDVGLRVDTIMLPEHRSYAATVAAGLADSMSFGFNALRAPYTQDGTQRTVQEARLREVSIVAAWPAYNSTTANVRFMAEAADVEPDLLAQALAALRDPEARLTTEQRSALVAAIDAKSDLPIPTHLAKWRAIMDARGY
jgi:HK97 family phage prohead protease